jgi:hypothetical protein
MCLRILGNYILKRKISKYMKEMVFEITYSLFPSPAPCHYIGPFSLTSQPKSLKGSIIDLTVEVQVGQLTMHQKAHITAPHFVLHSHPGGYLSIRESTSICDHERNPR